MEIDLFFNAEDADGDGIIDNKVKGPLQILFKFKSHPSRTFT